MIGCKDAIFSLTSLAKYSIIILNCVCIFGEEEWKDGGTAGTAWRADIMKFKEEKK